VLSALIKGGALLAAPAFVQGQSPLTVRFVQQRGLLYIPVDVMVSGGILRQEATKLGLGKVEATATALSGPGPVRGLAVLAHRVGAHARQHQRGQGGRRRHGAMTLYTINPNVKTLADFGEQDCIAVPTVRLSFNAMMLQMAEQLWGDPHRLDHLTEALGPPRRGHRAVGRLWQGDNHGAHRRAALHETRPETAGRARYLPITARSLAAR
jgi:NitT/TauT family transport system substrate-binding protein